MKFKFSKTSRKRLHGVHPDLIRVLSMAIEHEDCPYDFGIAWYGGLRTIEMQEELYSYGRTTEQLRKKGIQDVEGKPEKKKVTWTLKSNHMIKADGFGHAVDLNVYDENGLTWKHEVYESVVRHIISIGEKLNVDIEWGYDLWNKDAPHIQLKQ